MKNEQVVDLDGYSQISGSFLYNISLELGGGSFGKVYRGYDKEKKKYIAVKFIPSTTLRRMHKPFREVEIMKKLDHPYIMSFYGSLVINTGNFYFLELCDGGTLEKEILQKKLTEPQILKYFKQITEAMVYLNGKDIFHRDLKPENILLTKNQDIKIADFGIARQTEGLVKTMMQCTLKYAAPEIFLEESNCYNEKCDVFSAGYILYELLSCGSLLQGINTAPQLISMMKETRAKGGFKIQYSSKLLAQKQWEELTRKMLRFDPKSRISFKEVLNILEKIQLGKTTDQGGFYDRQYSAGEIKISKDKLQKVKSFGNVIKRKNCYYLNMFLKVIKSGICEKIPEVMKKLLVYSSMGAYLTRTYDTEYLLSTKQFSIPDLDYYEVIYEDLIEDHKLELLEYMKSLQKSLSSGLAQLVPLYTEVCTAIFQYFTVQKDTPEKQFLSEYAINHALETYLKSGDLALENIYNQIFTKCTDNFYKTSSQLESMSSLELQIYLIMLKTKRLMGIHQNQGIQNLKLHSLQEIQSFSKEETLSKIMFELKMNY